MSILLLEFSDAALLSWCFVLLLQDTSRDEQGMQSSWLSRIHTWCSSSFLMVIILAPSGSLKEKNSNLHSSTQKFDYCTDWHRHLQSLDGWDLARHSIISLTPKCRILKAADAFLTLIWITTWSMSSMQRKQRARYSWSASSLITSPVPIWASNKLALQTAQILLYYKDKINNGTAEGKERWGIESQREERWNAGQGGRWILEQSLLGNMRMWKENTGRAMRGSPTSQAWAQQRCSITSASVSHTDKIDLGVKAGRSRE